MWVDGQPLNNLFGCRIHACGLCGRRTFLQVAPDEPLSTTGGRRTGPPVHGGGRRRAPQRFGAAVTRSRTSCPQPAVHAVHRLSTGVPRGPAGSATGLRQLSGGGVGASAAFRPRRCVPAIPGRTVEKAAHRVIQVVHILVPTLCTKRVRLLTSSSPGVGPGVTGFTCGDRGAQSADHSAAAQRRVPSGGHSVMKPGMTRATRPAVCGQPGAPVAVREVSCGRSA